MRTYIVERYLLGVTAGQLEEASARLAAAAEELTMQGTAVRAHGLDVRSRGGVLLLQVEGANAARRSRRACQAAGISSARIVETHDLAPVKEEQ